MFICGDFISVINEVRDVSRPEGAARALLKIRQTIINGQWRNWWYKKRDKKIEIKAIFKKALTAADMNKRDEIAPFTPSEKTTDSADCWRMKFSNG